MLDEKEIKLSEHLSVLFADDKYDVGSVVAAVLPKYWEQVGENRRSLSPQPIFRSLYYVHSYADQIDFAGKTRIFLDFICGHLEGCLFSLYANVSRYAQSKLTFGKLIEVLYGMNILSDKLAGQLWAFNRTVNIPSKHLGALDMPVALEERTFSVLDAACAFVMMRKLSVLLFALLKEKGVLQADWPSLDERWLDWSPLIQEDQPRERNSKDVL